MNIINIVCKSSNNFDAKVSKLCKGVKEVYIKKLDLFCACGYGQYKDYLTIEIDEKELKVSQYHTNSSLKDWYEDQENNTTINNFHKRRILELINLI
jgi:hypothetical protein